MRKIINISFTNQVLQLRKNNVSIKRIAKTLQVSNDTISRTVRVLKKEGLLPKKHPRDPLTADANGITLHTKQLDGMVFNVLKENPKLRDEEIVEQLSNPHMLGMKVSAITVKRSRRRLVTEGLLSRRQISPEESLQIEKQVTKLLKRGLTHREIATRLGISFIQVRNAAHRLVNKGKLIPKTFHVQFYIDFVKQYVAKHANEPVNAAEIARQLGISREWARQLYIRVKTE